MTPPRHVVVVGAGAAGLSTAEALRDDGFGGDVTVIGEEPHAPYDRPPLSKQFLAGEWEPERLRLRTAPDLDVDLVLGVRVTGADVAAQTVSIGDRTIRYEALVVATGVTPRRPAALRAPDVLVLRTLDDALALRARLVPATRVAVIGAGFLGNEIAATARILGCEVSLIAPRGPLAGRFGTHVGSAVRRLHAARGVRVVEAPAVAIVPGIGVETGDGTRVHAEVIVAAVGSTPTLGWLGRSALPIDDGLLCDGRGRAGPSVYGAGDVARWASSRFGDALRVEHRMNATEQAAHVARAILGEVDTLDPIPYLWSDLYDVRLQGYGIHPRDAECELVDEHPGSGTFLVRYRRNGRIVGAMAAGMPAAIRGERALIDADTGRGLP